MIEKKIIILCLVGQFGNGGTEKQLYLFLKYLDRSKYIPVVVVSTADTGAKWQDIIHNELQINIHFLGSGPKPFKIARYVSILCAIQPDLIFSWSFHTNAYYSFSFRRKFIGSLRGQFSMAKSELTIFHLKKSLSPPYFVVNSTMIQKELIDQGITPEKVNVISNIFEPEKECSLGKSELRKQFGIRDDEILVAGAGRNTPEKDFSFFVDVFSSACKIKRDLKAILIGSGGLGVKNKIKELGLSDNIVLTGEVPYARKLLPCADIFFLSSIYEGMPNVLLEAIDSGCTPIAMNIGGVLDILGNDNPHLECIIPPERDAMIVSKMLINLADNPNLRNKICHFNKDNRINQFKWDKIMPLYYNLFGTILNRI